MVWNHKTNILVDPKSGTPLTKESETLYNPTKNIRYEIKNDIACLLNQADLSAKVQHEMEVFDQLDIKDVSYFRESLFNEIWGRIDRSASWKSMPNFVELGGGEGHWAGYVKKRLPQAEGYVCDISFNTLQRAPANLNRVCADVTTRIFAKESIHLAAFWVSLHHLDQEQVKNAIKEVYDALAPQGLLIVFEPNASFFPRWIMYNSFLGRDVYHDDEEQAVQFNDFENLAVATGFKKLQNDFLNPPYNTDFVKKLKKWWLYLVVVEGLHYLDKYFVRVLFGKSNKYLSLYGLSIFQK